MATRAVALLAVLAGLAVASRAQAVWLQPDESYREAQLLLRLAIRDTTGHPDDPGRLDSLGVSLLKLARLDEARAVFRRANELAPSDAIARAGLGKLALFDDRPAEAESLLAGADTADPGAANDLFAARLRQGKFAAAAEMTPLVNLEGRRELLEKLAERAPYEVTGPDHSTIPFASGYPVVLIKVKINGQRVLMAVDTGASDVMLDESAFRRYHATPVAGQNVMFWAGTRTVVKNAIIQRLDIGGYKIENCPAGVMNLGRWSLEVNPQSEKVAGVIGLNLLRRFRPTIDFKKFTLELRRPETTWAPAPGAALVPFQLWGESELMVYGSLGQSRRMAMVIQTGVPHCGVGAPVEVMDEIGVKAGVVSRMVKGAGTFLQGRPWAAAVVPAVTLGPVARDKLAGWVGALDSSELWRHGVRRDALISHDFFKGRRVTIDWATHNLVFEE